MPDVNVVALFKGTHRYVYVYDDASREELLGAIRDAAADPAAPLNWFDAAVLAERVAEQCADPEPARF